MASIVSKLLRAIYPLFFLGVCSCSRPLEGQVFVVTSGAGNYKLGLVPIFIVNQGDYDKLKLGYSELVTKLQTSKQDVAKNAHEKLATLKKDYEAKLKKSDTSDQSYKEAERQLLAFTKGDNAVVDSFNGEPETEAREACQRFIENHLKDFLGQEAKVSLARIPKALYEKLEAQLTNSTSTENTNVDVAAADLLRVAKDYYVQLKQLSSAYDKKEKEMFESLDAAVRSEKQVNEAIDRLSYAQSNLELSDVEKHRLLAEALVAVTPATKTGADGEFKLDDVSGAKYLIALGERKVASESEQYAWIIPLSDSGSFSGKGTVILSNDNMSSPDVLLN